MTHSRRIILTAVALLALAAALPSAASAAYEQVGIFAPQPGENPSQGAQLGGVGGMAVNRTGAGGVPVGTVYASTQLPAVARYNPDGTFSEAWTGFPNVGPPSERCGPDGEPAHPTCAPHVPGSGTGTAGNDVEVDQATGYVYVLTYNTQPGKLAIAVYSADGSEVITRFGQMAPEEKAGFGSGSNIDATPEDLHIMAKGGSLAIDQATGDVYVYDRGYINENEYTRLIVFEPTIPGDYANYAYAGRNRDIWAGTNNSFPSSPSTPVTDDAGHLYVSDEQSIAKLDPHNPSGPPLCELDYKKGGIEAITVNPVTEEVFFSRNFKDGKIHQLRGHCGSDGQFVEAGSFSLDPPQQFVNALAVNPGSSFDPSRPPGILYVGVGTGSQGYIFAPPAGLPPSVESESVSQVTASTAVLHAQIDPKSNATRYVFQYLSKAAYEEAGDSFAGAAEVPLGGAPLGEGKQALSAGAALAGLVPDTDYRFRVVASSFCNQEEPEVPCEAFGQGHSFHTYPVEAPGLPDHRAWEMVSPTQKHGGQVFPADATRSSCEFSECKPGSFSSFPGFPLLTSADGDAIAYRGSSFAPSEGALGENQYVARRTSVGWQTEMPTPRMLLQGSTGGAYAAFDQGLNHATLFQGYRGPALSPVAPPNYQDIYSQPVASPFTVTPLLTEAPPNRDAEAFRLRYAGASEDLSRVFFEANDALTGVSADAPEASDGGAEKNNLYESSAAGLRLVNVDPSNASSEPGAHFGGGGTAISADGARVFWVGADGQIYLREDARRTVEVSASQRATEDPVHSLPTFLGASADGARVLFSSAQKLTDDAGSGTNLYLWQEGDLTDLTVGSDPGEFRRLVGSSEDLSRVYFIDGARLDQTPSQRGERATQGADNLYLSTGGAARLIAVPVPVNQGGASVNEATTSPNGQWLAFSSNDPLTGFENRGPCDRNGEIRTSYCAEIFLYDSATESLTCPSCNRSGAIPLGSSSIKQVRTAAPQRPLHFLTDTGRLYFDSQDSLVPADTNEGAEDVYEYEPDGEGTCARGGGCVSLVSAGRNHSDSNLAAISADGRDVFFTTWDQLALKDEDDLMDLYDAREGGGIPAESQTASPECQGETCLPVYSPPRDATPGSSTFSGSGNVHELPAKRCSNGKNGKCAKKKAAKKHRRHKRHNRRATGQARRAHR